MILEQANPYTNQVDNLNYGASFSNTVPSTLTLTFGLPFTGNLVVSANAAVYAVNPILSCNGTTQTVAVTPQDGLIAYYDLGQVVDATTITYSGSSTLNFWGILLDGVNLVPIGGITLSVTDDQDLQFFNVNDVIQGNEPLTGIAKYNDSRAANPLGWTDVTLIEVDPYTVSNRFTPEGSTTSHAMNLFYVATPAKSVAYNLYDSGSWTGNATPVFNGFVSTDGQTWTQVAANATLPLNITDGVNSYSYFAVTGGGGDGSNYFYGWFFDASNADTVKSIDVANKNLVVSGGAWIGSDGTTSGDGRYLPAQQWSDYLSAPGGFDPSYPATVAFNSSSKPNSLGGYAAVTANNNGTTITFNANSLNLSGEVRVMANVSQTITMKGKGSATITTLSSGTGTADAATWTTMGTPVGGLEYITSTDLKGGGAASSASNLSAIEVGGKVLVDLSVPGAGETIVTGPAKSGNGLFVSTNGTNSMSLTETNLEWISSDNRLSKPFFAKPLVTALNASNPKHVALQQAIATAFANVPTNAAPALTGDLYRLLAGETLTAGEIATLTDRLTAATHGNRPFHLAGYYPLYYTAAGANAASPDSSGHHTHVLDGNTYYMPNGVTVYHGNYVPTVTSYTVSPNITTTQSSGNSGNSSSGGGNSGGGGGGGGGGY